MGPANTPHSDKTTTPFTYAKPAIPYVNSLLLQNHCRTAPYPWGRAGVGAANNPQRDKTQMPTPSTKQTYLHIQTLLSRM